MGKEKNKLLNLRNLFTTLTNRRNPLYMFKRLLHVCLINVSNFHIAVYTVSVHASRLVFLFYVTCYEDLIKCERFFWVTFHDDCEYECYISHEFCTVVEIRWMSCRGRQIKCSFHLLSFEEFEPAVKLNCGEINQQENKNKK